MISKVYGSGRGAGRRPQQDCMASERRNLRHVASKAPPGRRWGAVLCPGGNPWGLAVFLSCWLSPSVASANGAIQLFGRMDLHVFWFVLSGASLLGCIPTSISAWYTALRPPDASGLIFARGFLGVVALTTFCAALLFAGFGVSDYLEFHAKGAAHELASVGSGVALASLPLFWLLLSAEFGIATRLYWRVYQARQSPWAITLSIASGALCALFALCGVGLAGLMLF